MDDPFAGIPSQSAKLRRDLKAIVYPELELPMICPGFIWVPGGRPAPPWEQLTLLEVE